MAQLKVVDKRTSDEKEVCFGDLDFGDVYEDSQGHVCIKIDHAHCIYKADDDGCWLHAFEDTEEVVFPLMASLIIEGRG